ncbi:hypothetical protein AHAS_Ahas19G0265800 [Arachis hypogaea]
MIFILVGWKPPDEAWYEINVDGSVFQTSEQKSCKCLIRDANDRVVSSFMMTMEKVTIIVVELWTIYMGLKIVIDMGVSKIRVETNSTYAVKCGRKNRTP